MPLGPSYDGWILRYRHSAGEFHLVAPTPPSGPVTLELSQYKGEIVPSGTMVTDSWSPSANHLLLCLVHIRGSQSPSGHVTGVSGNGLTWTKKTEKDDTQNSLCFQVWWALGSPSVGAVTLALNFLTVNIGVQLLSFSNVNLTTPLGNVANVDTGSTDTNTGNVNLTTSANNSKIVMHAVNRNQVPSVPGGSIFSPVLVNQKIDSGGSIGTSSSWLSSEIATSGTVQNCLFNLSSAGDWAMGAVEILGT